MNFSTLLFEIDSIENIVKCVRNNKHLIAPFAYEPTAIVLHSYVETDLSYIRTYVHTILYTKLYIV